MKIFLILLAVLLVLGYFFVQWANKPENVAALQQDRKDKAAQKAANEQQKAMLAQENEAKIAKMTLAIDENFAQQKFNFLNYNTTDGDIIRFEDGKAVYKTLITKGQSARDYFIFSKEEYQDFVAEIDFEIAGNRTFCGIVFDAQLSDRGYPTTHQAAYSSLGYLYVQRDEMDNFRIGGFMESINKQVLRVEKIGTHLKAQINGKVLFDEIVTTNSQGKIGIMLAHGGGGEYPASIIVEVKSFKVWR